MHVTLSRPTSRVGAEALRKRAGEIRCDKKTLGENGADPSNRGDGTEVNVQGVVRTYVVSIPSCCGHDAPQFSNSLPSPYLALALFTYQHQLETLCCFFDTP